MPLSEGAIEDFVARCAERVPAMLRFRGHQVDFLPGGPVLAVSFEPAATGKIEPDLGRPAWGQAFLQKRGHSVLGVKREATDWYRSAELHQLFRAMQVQGLFGRFERVLFYGPSMGGYAALSLAAAAPGCTVLALNPQSTLAPDRVWFDQRFAGPRAAAWEGDFVDGADGAAAAGRVYVCYDPYQVKDRLHAERLPAHNLVRLRLPFVGHTTAQALNAMGLLGTVFDQALAGSLDEPGFRRLARERARLADYHCRLAERGRWMPRKRRLLVRALELDPAHARAALLQRLWAEAPAAPDVPKQRRWPMGVVTAAQVPLIYLNLPKSASTTIQNHLLYIAQGRPAERPEEIHRHEGLRRSREDNDATHALIERQLDEGALVFTFVRDPGRRAYACFNEKIAQQGKNSFVAIQHELTRRWGLRLPGAEEPTPLELQRENFAAFLRFVEANLAGDTDIRRDPHWCPQGPMLVAYRKHFKIDVVGKVENFAADMALVLHKAGVRRVPDLTQRPWRHPPAPYSFDELLTPELQAQLDRLYEADYRHLGYGRAE
ncbi:MAG TPA: sulfotransferase family 2 domain-containing protein [Ideonella sp.]|nr:sulfotransferase family 2 domain-containing protein [Ideonella sp.]